MIDIMTVDGYTKRNRVQLIRGGEEYFLLLHELISKAKNVLYLQYYIFDDDETGRSVKAALENAAARGVNVYLLVDGYASQKLSRPFVDELRQAGVRFKWFEPLFKSRKFYFGRRMHHKVVVADGIGSLVGGINISNRYNDMPDQPAWADTALYCEGEASLELHSLCRKMWDRTKVNQPDLTIAESYSEITDKSNYQNVRIRQNDWVKRKNQVTKSYLYMLLHAQKEITIMCSYFIPGKVFRREISNAAKRGVRVRTILAGPSDVMVAKHAERYLYDWLLKNNIEIYEYQETVLHAKVAAYDNKWVTVGSYNVNNISAYASLELNLDVKDDLFAQKTTELINDIIEKKCKRITRDNYTSSISFFRRAWQRFCYSFISNMLSLFTFYFKQEE